MAFYQTKELIDSVFNAVADAPSEVSSAKDATPQALPHSPAIIDPATFFGHPAAEDSRFPIGIFNSRRPGNKDNIQQIENHIIETGFSGLDKLLGNLEAGSLTLIAGLPGVGKTSLALDITTHTATEAGTPVGFFSFEIGREELLIRLISARSRVQLDSIYSGFITTTERENLDATLASLYRAPIHIDDNPRHSIASIREQIKECKDKLGLKLLVIDCLQLIKNKDHATTSSKLSEKTLRAMSLELKAIAKEFSLAIISLYQLPQTWQSKKIIPHPTFILGRGAAEKYNADKIILIYRRSVCRECQSPIELCTCSLNHDTRLVVSGSDTIQDVTHLRFLTDSVHFETPAC